ncbi:MAG TPA: terminase [Gammaproteobacteria bacterium]|nr:terminase [Gammaproteobacteria bacterium]
MAGKRGRPSAFRKEMVKQAEKLCALGATDQEMADFFDVDVRTFYRWKNANEDFCQALKVGKQAADERVERSLYMKAIGYEQDETKIFMPAGAEQPVYAPYRAKIAPDTTACIFWLKNRKPKDWRDKQEVEHSGELEPLKVVIGATRPASKAG